MLITIGVIGVVAAITLPSVISNIQGMQYRSKVKKVYATLTQAVSLAKANYDVDLDSLTTACVDGENDKLPSTLSVCALLNSTLSGAKYISRTDPNHPKNYIENSRWHDAYHLADGSVVSFDLRPSLSYDGSFGSYTTYAVFFGYIDVNGKTGPNKQTYATDCQKKLVAESYSDGDTHFEADVCYGKPDNFYDIYPFTIPLKEYDKPVGLPTNIGALRYVLTH